MMIIIMDQMDLLYYEYDYYCCNYYYYLKYEKVILYIFNNTKNVSAHIICKHEETINTKAKYPR